MPGKLTPELQVTNFMISSTPTLSGKHETEQSSVPFTNRLENVLKYVKIVSVCCHSC